MKTKGLILISLLFIVFAKVSKAQDFTFRHLTTNEGLSQITVNSIYIDEYGFVWIGTRDGLCRYNGNDIKTFKLQKGNPNSLFCNTVIQLEGNQEGIIYLLCTEGLSEFNFKTEKFTTLIEGDVGAIYYNEVLYIGLGNELCIFDPDLRKIVPFFRLPDKYARISRLLKDNNGIFWIGTSNNGLYRLNTENKVLIDQPVKKGNITSIYKDKEYGIWVGSWTNGLFWFTKDSIKNFRYNPIDKNGLCSDFVRDCCEDNAGYMWIGTFHGLNRYDKKTGEFMRFEADINNPESLTHSSIWCIVKDQQGSLWMGTYFGGVNYFNPEYEIYTRFKMSTKEEEGLSSPIVSHMLEDKHGNLWIATEGGGLNKYDPKTKTFKWYKHIPGQNSISQNNIKALYYDTDHDCLWIGTHLGSLNKLDLKTNLFTNYPSKEGDNESLPSNIIRDIVPYKDSLIIATQNGVCMFNPVDGKCRQMFKDIKLGHSIKMVASLFFDHEGTLWIAATGEGVFAYRFDTNELTNYRHDPKDSTSLSNNNVNDITESHYNDLWFSTSGSGLDRYNYKTKTFENFDMQSNGLSSDCVYSVCESRYGKLLVITNKGFSQFDQSSKSFYNYTIEDGFPLMTANENALYLSAEGEVFLGGVTGLISFNEKDLRFAPKPYNIILNRLSVNGKDVKINDDTGILHNSLCNTKEITLQSQHSVFSIEFAVSNFIPANKDEIIYKLEGFSDKWTETHGQHSITYTNLNPGKYILIIKGKNNPFTPEAKLYIKVLPPFYKTIYAYTIYILVIGIILFYLIRTYKGRIKLQESLKYEKKHIQDIERLNQSKLRFFTNISHEFRTPLTLITGYAEMLMQVQSFAPAVYNKILGIYKNCLQLQELITELLDFRKQEQGHMKIKVWHYDIVNFLYENYLIFKEYTAAKQIQFIFQKEIDTLDVWFDAKQMQKVINNLISNALKHTKKDGIITIKVRKENNEAVIDVNDTGTGIAPEDIDKIFDRFYQNAQTQSGTGIGLAFAKGIVELHHGTINVNSELGKGATFTIRLKLGETHFKKEQICEPENTTKPLLEIAKPEIDLREQELTDTPALKNNNVKMLIVEDNDELKEMLVSIFSTFYTVITSSDGQDGWEKVKEELPDIVLSDVMIPRMSGTELCKLIKNDIDTCHIPVVLITARTAIEYNMEGLRLGADDYVTKPFNINLLVSRCNNLVNSRIILQEKFSKQPQTALKMLATNAMDKNILDKAVKIIEKYIDNPEFNINIFAREMGIARTNLFAKIKAITGQTPNEFISTIRLKKAAILLKNNPELNISEISDMVGFNSSRYFSKCFKAQYHINPISYRKGISGEEEDNNESMSENVY